MNEYVYHYAGTNLILSTDAHVAMHVIKTTLFPMWRLFFSSLYVIETRTSLEIFTHLQFVAVKYNYEHAACRAKKVIYCYINYIKNTLFYNL